MIDLLILLRHLSDGHFHSGEDLALEMNVSRTAIWKKIQKLNTILPVNITSVRSKGYKIEEPILILDENAILAHLSASSREQLNGLEVLLECASTNQYLLEQLENKQCKNCVVLAESQTQGRGRRGRYWASPFGCNIYMSLSWALGISISEMAGLSLVVAISVANAIKNNGIENVKLKWPNDVYIDGHKLSGVLLELRGESNSPCQAVIGIGVNVNMPYAIGKEIDQPWVDMRSILGKSVNRNKVVADILDELISNLALFEREGFSAFTEQWKRLDLLENEQIEIQGHPVIRYGLARGVDLQGALLVEFENKIQPIYSGEVSTRLK